MFIILLIASEKQITLDMNLQFAICNFFRLYDKTLCISVCYSKV